MTTQITEGIKISVKTFPMSQRDFQIGWNPSENHEKYFFSYRITIENQSRHTVQLLKRQWEIFDSSGIYKEVSGEGVVGEKPILQPGEIYEYESACGFTSEMGRMKGAYLMERKTDGKLFSVNVPVFEMYVPYRLN